MADAGQNTSDRQQAAALPIEAQLADILAALNSFSQALLVAEPGAGKTTRVPLALLNAPWCQGKKLLLLEPRRVAARLAAGFMAEQLGEALGETVGYRMRGETRVSANTRLEVVTQGVLTRMLQDDPLLEGIAGIIFDEFHERSLEADLGLALALDAQTVRDDLRLLVMSATLDVASLTAVLGEDTPVVDCPGRQFPVETRYREAAGRDPVAHQAEVIAEALAKDSGDVLVILPGVGEIRRLKSALASRFSGLASAPVVGELHGRQSLAEQRRVLRPVSDAQRRVVLSTAIVESSVTVDGVGVVIDAGRERLAVYQPRSGLTRLETRRINRASADQRRGRAGRLGPGVCYRLWGEEQPLPADREPEILQADLSSLAFELARWGITEPQALQWITPPPIGAMKAGQKLLARLGLLDEHGHLTPLGHRCERWPASPRSALLLSQASELGANIAALACCLVAWLDVRDAGGEQDPLDALRKHLARPNDFQHWRREAERLLKLMPAGVRNVRLAQVDLPHDSAYISQLLAMAWPERIAQHISPGEFRLVSGAKATLDARSSLARAELIIAIALDGRDGGGRIYRATPLSHQSLVECFPEALTWRDHLVWDDDQGCLVGEQRQGLGAVILARRPLRGKPPEVVRQALIDALERRQRLPFDTEGEQLRGRVALLRRELGERWPDWSDASLLTDLDFWLGPHVAGLQSIDDIAKLPLSRVLLNRLDWSLRSQLDTLAPTHLQVPSGSRVALDYTDDIPVLAVKLQELFGWQDVPTLAEGRVAPLVHLLSPARRPLQVTRDLASFWANGYIEVRKDMRGRYPRHPWPEDPLSATATASVKPRR
ncbi:ATP-dependent helicase HrpB [Halomonas halocynthiae]|uniref:ATP-dependent helicase HrpB n=1 Tax=Halomonas halocynthiae TaxID=176290 RepID=UPI0003FC1841|nr:ATP-dependent helicase HrpB [Halomonas halocynthiae]